MDNKTLNNLLDKMQKFEEAALDLNKLMNSIDQDQQISDVYPFDNSFPTITEQIISWRRLMQSIQSGYKPFNRQKAVNGEPCIYISSPERFTDPVLKIRVIDELKNPSNILATFENGNYCWVDNEGSVNNGEGNIFML